MKVSLSELKKWVNIDKTPAELMHALTMTGLEVEGSELAAKPFEKIVIGEVLTVQPHPDADKLKLCEVNVGQAQSLKIVCGASNVAAGCRVPVALQGAILPNGMEIKKGKIRGVESKGMLCSKAELGLEEQSNGLWLLEKEVPVGQLIRHYFDLDDITIELNVTPNRGDCLSVLGVAREVSAIEAKPLNQLKVDICQPQHDKQQKINIHIAEACPRYLGRIVEGIQSDVISPYWLSESLRRMGIRSISPVVDVLNYVMLELGQPMHAFDLDKINGEMHVRYAQFNEKLTLLNQQQIQLTDQTLVIADDQGPLALAGIMGGVETSVTHHTHNIFLESAFFTPHLIAGKARQYGLHTDSSQRFERGVDPAMAEKALERATQLLMQIVGGKPGPIIRQENSQFLPKTVEINLNIDKVTAALGMPFSVEQVTQLLTSVGMQVEKITAQSLKVIVPSHRFDIYIEADLIEEVARLFGYDHLPTHSIISGASAHFSNEFYREQRIKNLLQDLGYNEAITYSFISAEQQANFCQGDSMQLANPISQEMAVMRTSIWPGLISATQYNLNRQQARVRLFEIGRQFGFNSQTLVQETVLSGLVTGSAFPEQWAEKNRKVDFYDIKGDVEKILQSFGIENADFEVSKHPALHPGQSASVMNNGQIIGDIGLLHPQVAKNLDVKVPVFLFELKLSNLLTEKTPQFKPFSKFPAIRRDFAFTVDRNVAAEAMLSKIKQTAGKWLEDILLFDVFVSDNLGSHKKSVAIGLTLQHPERTLNDAEVQNLSQQIVDVMQKEFAATLRE